MSFLFIFLLHLMVSFSDSFTCAPEVDCRRTGEMVPDSKNCSNYYYCLSLLIPSAGPLTCTDGQYFDTTVGLCQYGSAVNECADNACVSSQRHGCVYTCTGNNYEYIADFYNCSQYHECSGPDPDNNAQECEAPNLYFNGDECVSDSSQCCNSCIPYCHHAVTQIVHPCDCTSFYICTVVGPVDITLKGTCNEGNYFDEEEQACVPAPSCVNFCPPQNCLI